MLKMKNAFTNNSKSTCDINSVAKNTLKCNYINLFQNFHFIKNDRIFILYDAQKRPLSPVTGKMISIHSKQHFTDLKTASDALEQFKNADGIGLILTNTKIGNICAIDVDSCIDKVGNITQETENILQLFQNAYIEISKSGKGIHILFVGRKNSDWHCKINTFNWCKSLECYDSNRYIALTANALSHNKILNNLQKELEIFYSRYFEKPEPKYSNTVININNLNKGLKQDKKFLQLWHGKKIFVDESRNDLSLMSKILYWNGYDIANAVELFKLSPYAAQKDYLHKLKIERADYLIRTAKKCLREVQNGKLLSSL